MKFEDILITPNQYLGGNRQAKRYLANPAATAFQSGNMHLNASGSFDADKGFDLVGNTAEELYNNQVKNPGPIKIRDPNNVTIQDPDSNGSGGSNGNQGSGGSGQPPVQANPVTSNPKPDPADQKDSKPGRDTGQNQDQKPDSSQYLYWAIPAVSIVLAIAVYIYGNS